MVGALITFIIVAVLFLGVRARSQRRLDTCLSQFGGFQVAIEFSDGRRVWGRLVTSRGGLELIYDAHQGDGTGQRKTSFILYPDELEDVRAIYRFVDELSDERQWVRKTDVERPQPKLQALQRQWRDLFVHKTATVRPFEPVLERHVQKNVVVEETVAGERSDLEGRLHTYSDAWLNLLDVEREEVSAFSLARLGQLHLNHNVDVTLTGNTKDGSAGLELKVENRGKRAMTIERVAAAGYERTVNATLEPSAQFYLHLDDLPAELFENIDVGKLPNGLHLRARRRLRADDLPVLPDINLFITGTRTFDVCLPRRTSRVRHGAESS